MDTLITILAALSTTLHRAAVYLAKRQATRLSKAAYMAADLESTITNHQCENVSWPSWPQLALWLAQRQSQATRAAFQTRKESQPPNGNQTVPAANTATAATLAGLTFNWVPGPRFTLRARSAPQPRPSTFPAGGTVSETASTLKHDT